MELPRNSRIHSVFHAVLLETVLQGMPIQTILQVEGEQEYKVKEILDFKMTQRGQEYLVSWKGYSAEENSWEPKENLRNCQ